VSEHERRMEAEAEWADGYKAGMRHAFEKAAGMARAAASLAPDEYQRGRTPDPGRCV